MWYLFISIKWNTLYNINMLLHLKIQKSYWRFCYTNYNINNYHLEGLGIFYIIFITLNKTHVTKRKTKNIRTRLQYDNRQQFLYFTLFFPILKVYFKLTLHKSIRLAARDTRSITRFHEWPGALRTRSSVHGSIDKLHIVAYA